MHAILIGNISCQPVNEEEALWKTISAISIA